LLKIGIFEDNLTLLDQLGVVSFKK
jgi:hypothetical protein